MRKKLTWLIGAILVIALIVFGCLYFIPKTTPIDITLDAVKTDNDDNELGIVQIHLHGTLKEYLFRSDRLTLFIDDFDHLYDIHPWANPNPDGSYPDLIVDLDAEGYEYESFGASSSITGENSAVLSVVFRTDLKKWELFVGPSIYVDKKYEDDPSFKIAYRATVE